MVDPYFAKAQKTKDVDSLSVLATNTGANGIPVEIIFKKGVQHYYPLMAIWVEDTSGHYIHSLYVAESIAKGIFSHANYADGKWQSGKKLIPSALPYWSHKQTDVRNDSISMTTPEHPLPDAYSGATPTSSFRLRSVVQPSAGEVFNVMFEINQSWDWNNYWYNSKFPGNKEYLKSAQPAVVYKATIDMGSSQATYQMEPVGHSHPYGATGELYKDLTTLTTALKIAKTITVKIIK